MGLYSFVANAGQKVLSMFGDSASAEDKQTALKKVLADLSLPTDAVMFEVKGDTVILKGTAPSQEIKEKIILAVGNIEGIAQVEEEIVVAAGAEKAANFYTVKSGDNLSRISKEQYGDAAKYTAIFEANKPMLTDPDKIYPGQVLRIPKAA